MLDVITRISCLAQKKIVTGQAKKLVSTEERSLTAKNHPAQPEANILSPVWLLELEVAWHRNVGTCSSDTKKQDRCCWSYTSWTNSLFSNQLLDSCLSFLLQLEC